MWQSCHIRSREITRSLCLLWRETLRRHLLRSENQNSLQQKNFPQKFPAASKRISRTGSESSVDFGRVGISAVMQDLTRPLNPRRPMQTSQGELLLESSGLRVCGRRVSARGAALLGVALAALCGSLWLAAGHGALPAGPPAAGTSKPDVTAPGKDGVCSDRETCLSIVDAFLERQPRQSFMGGKGVGLMQTFGPDSFDGGPCGDKMCKLVGPCPNYEQTPHCRFDVYDNALAVRACPHCRCAALHSAAYTVRAALHGHSAFLASQRAAGGCRVQPRTLALRWCNPGSRAVAEQNHG